MSNYIKPTFKLAAVAGNARAGSGCNVSDAEMEDVRGFLNDFGLTLNNAFADTEACIDQVPGTIYCKFASVETPGNLKILGS